VHTEIQQSFMPCDFMAHSPQDKAHPAVVFKHSYFIECHPSDKYGTTPQIKVCYSHDKVNDYRNRGCTWYANS